MAEDEDENRALLLTFLVEAESPGLIIDAARAQVSPCKCLEDKPLKFCFVPGVIGTLTGVQALELCAGKPVTILSDGRRERFQKFREAAVVCSAEVAGLPKGERLRPRLQCLSRELKKRSVEV